MPKTRAVLITLLAVPMLALGACGGDDGNSDKDTLTKIIKDGNSKPATVCDHLTDALLEQIGGAEGCKQAAAQQKPDDSTDITSLEIDGDKATAKVKDDDGDNTIQFVKQDGEWKVTDTK